jgi:hypothetical protein
VYKRRTVKYLELLIRKYMETLTESKRKQFTCGKVTGYSVKCTTSYNTFGEVEANIENTK